MTALRTWAFWAAGLALAQPPEAVRGGAGLQSPEVLADGRIVFRLRAPNAREVFVRGIAPEPIPMSRSEDGIWTAVTEPLKPDLYEYSFVVDGLTVLNPLN